MNDLTKFEKVKQEDWEKFGKENPTSTIELIMENSWFIVCFLLILSFALIPLWVEAAEWNEKPVMCAGKKETFETIKSKNEVLFFSGLTYAKVRNERGLDVVPAKIPFNFYINLKTGTYTVIEYHVDYSSYCVIAYGVNLQSFVGGIE